RALALLVMTRKSPVQSDQAGKELVNFCGVCAAIGRTGTVQPAQCNRNRGKPEPGQTGTGANRNRGNRPKLAQILDHASVSTLRRICSISSKCSWVHVSGGESWMTGSPRSSARQT